MSTELMKLKYVLTNIDTFQWTFSLYSDRSSPFSLETDCLVYDPNDVESDEDELPKVVIELGLSDTLGIQDIQSIVENAKLQKPNASVGDLLSAFVFYMENDAFINC